MHLYALEHVLSVPLKTFSTLFTMVFSQIRYTRKGSYLLWFKSMIYSSGETRLSVKV